MNDTDVGRKSVARKNQQSGEDLSKMGQYVQDFLATGVAPALSSPAARNMFNSRVAAQMATQLSSQTALQNQQQAAIAAQQQQMADAEAERARVEAAEGQRRKLDKTQRVAAQMAAASRGAITA